MTNRIQRFRMSNAADSAAIAVAAVPASIARSANQPSPASSANSGLAQIYAIAHQRAVQTVETSRWNRLMHKIMEIDE